jgi:hypothetical protein
MLLDAALKFGRLVLAVVVCAVASPTIRAEEPPPAPGLSAFLAPWLADWISASRDAAVVAGVEPLPAGIRKALTGYVPQSVLDRIRWRVGSGGDLTLQQTAIGFGDVPAMTLGHVIVFKSRGEALEDSTLWAHEIKHVLQFDEWGIEGFAARYLNNYEAIEFAANEYRWQYMKQAGLVPPVPSNTD